MEGEAVYQNLTSCRTFVNDVYLSENIPDN